MNDATATTFIGIDVHARSAAACAINGLTGEIERASFGAGYTAAEIAEWALGFERPAAVNCLPFLGHEKWEVFLCPPI